MSTPTLASPRPSVRTPETAPRSCDPGALPPDRVMYRALIERDTSFDGVFVVGVRTTGVFCRPGCGARKPLPANVEYFPGPPAAMHAGYRPCRRCRPLAADDAPDWFERAVELAESTPEQRLTAADLRAAGLDPVRVTRYFKRRFGVTFQAFHRARRIGRAIRHVRSGGGVLHGALRAGFDSESGFRAACERLFGKPPSQAARQPAATLTARWLNTPLGSMLAVASDEGLCLLEFVERRALASQIATLRRRFRAVIVPGDHAHLRSLATEIEQYFAGRLRRFQTPVVLRGSPFQERVWRTLLEIPAGQTRSYAWLAREVGQPTAVRAVAQANGKNRIAILVPCHRVIGSDGRLTGYGGGLWRKQRLLSLENG